MIRFIIDTIAIQAVLLGPAIARHYPEHSTSRSIVTYTYIGFVTAAMIQWLADYAREAIGRYRSFKRRARNFREKVR